MALDNRPWASREKGARRQRLFDAGRGGCGRGSRVASRDWLWMTELAD